MNTYSCLEIQEQLLTQRQINRDQSRLIESKQHIIEDQARLINSQQQLIDMMYDKIQLLKVDIDRLQSEVGEEGSSSQYQHYQSCYHHQHKHHPNIGYGSSNGGENSNENLPSNDFDHEGKYRNRVFLKNVKSSISLKILRNNLERSFGAISDISQPDPNQQFAFAYFKDRQHCRKALDKGSIAIDGITINISSGPHK